MRKLIITVSSLVFLSCGNQSNKSLIIEPKDVIVSGKAENAEGKVIQFTSTEFVGKDIVSGVVEDNNEFFVKIPIYHYHDVQVEFDGLRFFFLSAPGDSLRIDIDSSGSILYSGDRAKTNQDILFLQQRINELKQQAGLYHKDDELKPSQYKQFINKFYNQGDSLINALSKRDLDPEAINWMKSDFSLECISELYDYVLDEQAGNVDSAFYDSISTYKFDIIYGKKNSRYYIDYINQHYEVLSNNRISGELQKSYGKLYYEKKYVELFRSYRSNLQKYFEDIPDFHKDVILAQMIYKISNKDIQVVDSVLSEAPQLFDDKTVYELFVKKIEAEKSMMQNYKTLDNLQKHSVVGDIFKKIAGKSENKVVYIDFWGTWCSKCYLEFPYSSKLEKDLSGKNIEFVYICLPPFNENKWNHTIEKYNLHGTHIVLNKEQAKIINSIFNFEGAPIYMIVNTKGEIINENAIRPHSDNIKQVLSKLAE